MDELTSVGSPVPCVSMADFERLFVRRAIRTWVDWESLNDSNCTVRALVLTDVEALRRCQTVWYHSHGDRADWRDQSARRTTVGEEADRIDRESLDPRLLDVPQVFPALDLGDGQLLLLDGNHRAVAMAALRDSIHVLLMVLVAPREPLLFPDLIHDIHRSTPPSLWLDQVAEIDAKFRGPEQPRRERPEREATQTTASDLEIRELMEVYGKRLDTEHALISSRMGWLLTLDSFLVAILGVTLANLDKLGISEIAFGLVWAVSTLGVVTNASCFFSNYWGGRAIDEASLCVTQELSSLTGHDKDLAGRWLARLRLYGRDPRSEPQRIGFWRPPSSIVHPWFLVPLVFTTTFGVVPVVLAYTWRMGPFAILLGFACVAIAPLLLGAFALFDSYYHMYRSGLKFSEYIQLRRHRQLAASRTAGEHRELARRQNLEELDRPVDQL